jgi:hypothetical protein
MAKSGNGKPGRRRRLRILPPIIWEAIREEYLAGATAPECARLYGVGLTTVRSRAAREGWRRIDPPRERASPPHGRADPDTDLGDAVLELQRRIGGDLDRVELSDLTRLASHRVSQSVMQGRAVDALRWRRLLETLKAEEEEIRRREAWARRHRDLTEAMADILHDDEEDPETLDDLDELDAGWDDDRDAGFDDDEAPETPPSLDFPADPSLGGDDDRDDLDAIFL